MESNKGPYYDPSTESVWGVEQGIKYSFDLEMVGLVAFDLPVKRRHNNG